MTGWKILTHDWRPPIQGGDPLCDGTIFPVTLPKVTLDTGGARCAPGWNFTRDIETGLRIANFWGGGRTRRVCLAEPSADWVERGDKLRCSQLTLVREATEEEIRGAIHRLSKPFGKHQDAMAEQQWLWWKALERPKWDRAAVAAGLQATLAARSLSWSLREYADARDARDARDAWAARNAWAARDARNAWAARADARDAWAAWDAWATRAARAARAAWDAWAARDARNAWAALTIQYASRAGWVPISPELLTTGIRDAYTNGVSIAIPTGPNELGWCMEKRI